MSETKIQWADYTFNPWRGCTKVNAGCTNCYAEVDRSVKIHGVKWGPNGTRVVAADSGWNKLRKWDKAAAYEEASLLGERVRPRVFCASLADVFEDWKGPMVDHSGRRLSMQNGMFAPKVRYEDSWLTMQDVRNRLFALIDATQNLDWLLLTKRPENVWRMWCEQGPTGVYYHRNRAAGPAYARENVWIGTSVSDQETADAAIPELLKLRDLTPCLFVSAEPLLGPVDLHHSICGATSGTMKEPMLSNLDLVIIGGESGPKARPCHLDWIRNLVAQCEESGTACFVKQLGANVWKDSDKTYRLLSRFVSKDGFRIEGDMEEHPYQPLTLKHPKGGEPSEWPEDVRVREYPSV